MTLEPPRLTHLEMQQLLPAQPRACSCLLTFRGRSGQTLMASSQNTEPQEGCCCLSPRDLIQIKASQTQGLPSFPAGISLPHLPWPWDAALASLALAAFPPGREARADQECLKGMGNLWMGQHSWKPGRSLERSLTGTPRDINLHVLQGSKGCFGCGKSLLFILAKLEPGRECLAVEDFVAPF